MQKKLKKICVFLSLFLCFSSPIRAIDCEYPAYDLTISYDENSNVTVNYDKFASSPKYHTFLALAKWGEGQYATSEIKIDQTLFSKYAGYACPSEMYVCEYGEWAFNIGSIKGSGIKVADYFTQVPCWLGAISDAACNYINESAHAYLKLDRKKLYIYTQEEYSNSSLPLYEGGRFSSEIFDSAEEGYDACSGGNDEWYAVMAGSVCGLVWGAIDTVWDSAVEDGVDLVYYKYANCNVVPYEGIYTPINVNCAQLTQKIYQYREKLNEYISCGEDDSYCKANSINNINKVEEGIKEYCSNILQSYDYIGGQKGCVDACLSIKDTLNSFKKGTDLYDDGNNIGECGFSARLLVWMNNILRWVKYILPVLVIIFGILDFIKAISDEKEDEMKKAQKRFIIRLIAAALVFIIPLILEFVLTKMGFGYDSCGLS